MAVLTGAVATATASGARFDGDAFEARGDAQVDARFEWLGELGRGASSEVRLARDRDTDRTVAVKIVRKRGLSDEDLEAVHREVAIHARLQHPNIVRLHAALETPSRLFLVLEHAPGGELFSALETARQFSEDVAARFMRQLLMAVQFLHANDVFHRDLKPENLLLSSSDLETARLMIADFGLSTLCKPSQARSTVCGTPAYIAPEVLRADFGFKYSRSADLWSVGVILFTMLSGKVPFEDDNQAVLFRKIQRAEYSMSTPEWKQVSEPARDLITSLLCVDAAQRLTASAALHHPWLAMPSSTPFAGWHRDNLRQLSQASRSFRVGVLKALAAQRFMQTV